MVGLVSPESSGQAGRLETQGIIDVMARVQRQLRSRIPSLLDDVSHFSLRPSTDWMRPTHIREGNLLYSESTDSNVNLIEKNTFTVTFRLVFDQISGYHGLGKLTHKNNHHSRYHFHFTGEENKSQRN